MHILMVTQTRLPATRYGGVERVVWDLAKALVAGGARVSLLAPQGSHCDFATVIVRDPERPLLTHIPVDADLVHFHANRAVEPLDRPYVLTQHGNVEGPIDRQSVFVSQSHAQNHGSERYVHNGLDWSRYPRPGLGARDRYFHFLGNAAWRVKNVRGAIRATRRAGQQLRVMGGTRINFRMGFRLTLDRHTQFLGMVDDARKAKVLEGSRGLVFPVIWHEPFGLAIIESLFYGCPLFGTPYGALPELVNQDTGFLTDSEEALAEALNDWRRFDPVVCHEHVLDRFSAERMAESYQAIYQLAVSGTPLNPELPPVRERLRDLPWNR